MAKAFDRIPRRPVRRRTPLLLAAPLALAAGLLVFTETGVGLPLRRSAPYDVEAARFHRCAGGVRANCVVDGDTFWYHGVKIRIADINAPEVGAPRCAGEARRGEAASARLQALLNAGPFSLARRAGETDRDRYGRRLREVTRGGVSLGEAMVGEGLAERWRGHRGDWCRART